MHKQRAGVPSLILASGPCSVQDALYHKPRARSFYDDEGRRICFNGSVSPSPITIGGVR
jgi:hypothetical protein